MWTEVLIIFFGMMVLVGGCAIQHNIRELIIRERDLRRSETVDGLRTIMIKILEAVKESRETSFVELEELRDSIGKTADELQKEKDLRLNAELQLRKQESKEKKKELSPEEVQQQLIGMF